MTNEASVRIGLDASELDAGFAKTKSGMNDLVSHVTEVAKGFVDGGNPIETFGNHLNGTFAAISAVTGVTEGLIGTLGGPWGIAIGGAVTIIGSLVGRLGENRAALDLVKIGNDALAESQSALSKVFDTTTGKLKTQNDYLLTRARLSGINMERDSINQARSAASVFDSSAVTNYRLYQRGKLGGLDTHAPVVQPLKEIVDALRSGHLSGRDAFKKADGTYFDRRGISKEAFEQAIWDFVSSRENHRQAGIIQSSMDAGKLDPSLRTPAQSVARPPRLSVPSSPKFTPASEPKVEETIAFKGVADTPLSFTPAMRADFVTGVQTMYKQVGKTSDTALKDQRAKWKGVADSIASAWGQSLQGMIKGTQNFRGMMLNIGNAILGEATKWIEKKASKFIAKELAQTAATTVGVTTRTGVEATGAATSAGISATSALTQIGHSAAVAAAGAYAAIAKIAYVGPILAPLAAAAALAGVMALGKSIFSAEGGMGQVPYDGAMFELHKDEMVLPASLATPMRSMLLGAGANNNVGAPANDTGITHNHYYNIKGMDGQDVHRVLMRHHQSVARAAEKAHRNGFTPRG